MTERIVLPPPPLPGDGFIVPLSSTADLHNEGREQMNCAGTYGETVRSGARYLYRVLAPERATLSIAKGPDGNWQIQQLKIKANQEPSGETILAVEEWLRRYSLSV